MLQKCNPTCKFFRCAKRALIVKGRRQFQRHSRRGNPLERGLIALCNWAGDLCQGPACQYAFCEKRALLPDGTCGLNLRRERRKIRSIEEEAEKDELRVKLKGKTLRRIKDLEYIE